MVKEVDHPGWFGKLFFDLRMKSTLGLFFVLFLSLGLLVTVQQLMTRQDIRQEAESDSATKTVQENFVGGVYEFTIDSDNVSLLSVDEHVIYDNLNKSGTAAKQFNTDITPGAHTIKIMYATNNPTQSLQVSWKKL